MPLAIVLTVVLLLLCAVLPKFVSSIIDIKSGQSPSYTDMVTIQLDLRGNSFTTTDKLALMCTAEATNISQDQMTMSEDDVHAAVTTFLKQLESAGIFSGFEPTVLSIQPKLMFDLTDSSQHIAVWTVSFTCDEKPYQSLLLDIDDETGQILCVSYNIYRSYEMETVWEHNAMVIDALTDIYFSQLGLVEAMNTAAINSEQIYDYNEVDGGVTEAVYMFESPLFGEFYIQFTVDGAGGFSTVFLQ
ncbi:MAG: hypothetical protein IJ017_07805 [Oscillospiraceae bacterium]|nr:hypothetical protein [Oscillospiraceae bacterium]